MMWIEPSEVTAALEKKPGFLTGAFSGTMFSRALSLASPAFIYVSQAESEAKTAREAGIISVPAFNDLKKLYDASRAEGGVSRGDFEKIFRKHNIDAAIALPLRPVFASDITTGGKPDLEGQIRLDLARNYGSAQGMDTMFAKIIHDFGLPKSVKIGDGHVFPLAEALRMDGVKDAVRKKLWDTGNDHAADNGLRAMEFAMAAQDRARAWLDMPALKYGVPENVTVPEKKWMPDVDTDGLKKQAKKAVRSFGMAVRDWIDRNLPAADDAESSPVMVKQHKPGG